MSERIHGYSCTTCGAMAAMVMGGSGTLFCCDAPMDLHQDATTESHLVGGVPPMEFNLSLPTKAVIRLIQNRVADHTTYFGV